MKKTDAKWKKKKISLKVLKERKNVNNGKLKNKMGKNKGKSRN